MRLFRFLLLYAYRATNSMNHKLFVQTQVYALSSKLANTHAQTATKAVHDMTQNVLGYIIMDIHLCGLRITHLKNIYILSYTQTFHNYNCKETLPIQTQVTLVSVLIQKITSYIQLQQTLVLMWACRWRLLTGLEFKQDSIFARNMNQQLAFIKGSVFRKGFKYYCFSISFKYYCRE